MAIGQIWNIFSINYGNYFFQPFFVERVFHIFDKDDNGSISLQEFIDAMHQFAGQSPDDKIKFLFKVYDIDGKSWSPAHSVYCDLSSSYFLKLTRETSAPWSSLD